MQIIKNAQREQVPQVISLAGPSGSGKTVSALLLAAGIANGGKVGFIDTENKRSSFYLDNSLVKKALPQGWDPLYLTAPFSPDRYTQALDAFEKAGDYKVVIVDSMTHEWEGFGGCTDIAENNKMGGTPNWAMAKLAHKRMMNKLLARPFTIIFCLRAREKVEMTKVGGKTVVKPMGMQPIQEKNFKFEMLVACMLDEKTQFPVETNDFHKIPEQLIGIFQGGRHITVQDGERIRQWIDGGKPIDMTSETLKRDIRDAAHDGTKILLTYWDTLTPEQKKAMESYKNECKLIAAEVDAQIAAQQAQDSMPSGDNF